MSQFRSQAPRSGATALDVLKKRYVTAQAASEKPVRRKPEAPDAIPDSQRLSVINPGSLPYLATSLPGALGAPS